MVAKFVRHHAQVAWTLDGWGRWLVRLIVAVVMDIGLLPGSLVILTIRRRGEPQLIGCGEEHSARVVGCEPTGRRVRER